MRIKMKKGYLLIWKRYIALYFYGILTAMAVIIVLYFCLEDYVCYYSYGYIPTEREIFLTEEHWIDVFSKYRNEIKTVEDFYHSIEDWEFVSVSFFAKKIVGEKVCFIEGNYLNESIIIENEYPVCNVLKLSLTSEDFSKNGCGIIILGDYMEAYASFFHPRILIIELYHSGDDFDHSTRYIYSPNEPLILKEDDFYNYDVKFFEEFYDYDIKFLGEGWYYLHRWVKDGIRVYH